MFFLVEFKFEKNYYKLHNLLVDKKKNLEIAKDNKSNKIIFWKQNKTHNLKDYYLNPINLKPKKKEKKN